MEQKERTGVLDKNRLKGAIASAGLTQNELASRIGISKNTLSSKMGGKGFFDTKQIDLICEVLGINDGETKANIFLSKSSQFRDIRAS